MIRFLADENFNNPILRGLRLRVPGVDVVRAQDTELLGADDPTVLEWGAREGRVLLTHDVNTMVAFAYERVGIGLPMPGVIAVSAALPIGEVIENLALIAQASLEGEYEGQVRFLPLR
jgi:hypothetical protein